MSHTGSKPVGARRHTPLRIRPALARRSSGFQPREAKEWPGAWPTLQSRRHMYDGAAILRPWLDLKVEMTWEERSVARFFNRLRQG